MRTRRTFQVLVVAVAASAGCAASRSSMVAVEPIAAGRPSELLHYDVAFEDGGGSARVFVGAGDAVMRSSRQAMVHVGLRVENLDGRQALRIPESELYLDQLGAGRIAAAEIDGGIVPQALEVPAGGARSFDVAFSLPDGLRVDDVHAFALHWALERESGSRALGTTELAAVERSRVYGPPIDSQGRPVQARNLPGAADQATRGMVRQPPFGAASGGSSVHARRQFMPPAAF